MKGYWVRHRLLLTIVMCAASAMVVGLLFAFPHITQQASNYNAQSIYKNSDMDFIAPEPSYAQVSEMTGTYGIDKVFPFYLTKTQVMVNGDSRTTTVLLSDQFQNVDITMYNEARLVEKSAADVTNPILIDWQFSQETSAKIGDNVSFSINGTTVEFQVYAIYETNSIYDGGAILAQITTEQADGIRSNSVNNGYSGIYISAADYNACRTYLTTDYRPLGRLKDRESFDSDEQYQIHHDAITSTGYANEITDFRVRENDAESENNAMMVWIGAILAAVVVIAFNILMKKRGCEKAYFTKICIPKGQNVKPYYKTSFVVESVLLVVLFTATLTMAVYTAKEFIPKSAMDIKILAIPAAIVVAEVISMIMNYAVVADITQKVAKKKKEAQ
ncbi:MAG: hypothetical protein GX642_01235 [Smithella sp.]|mgnify:FL=1|jgi:hypothetical protein|nr:hypothetical protein [Smithella sp.]